MHGSFFFIRIQIFDLNLLIVEHEDNTNNRDSFAIILPSFSNQTSRTFKILFRLSVNLIWFLAVL